MPSRDEIVEWFKEAAEHGDRMGYKHLSSYFKKRANQVASMRCETCQLYEPETDETDDECLHPEMLIRGQGKDFGCFHHEQKPAD